MTDLHGGAVQTRATLFTDADINNSVGYSMVQADTIGLHGSSRRAPLQSPRSFWRDKADGGGREVTR